MGSANSVLQAQRSLRLAKAAREPMCVNISDITEQHYSFRAATINGVRYGPSDLRATRELYRFGWEHERQLWIGCVATDAFRMIGVGRGAGRHGDGGSTCFAVIVQVAGGTGPALVVPPPALSPAAMLSMHMYYIVCV